MFGKFVSLGWFCGTAASMSKYGLRSGAGPVDWCFTELEELIHLIDTDFEHFMEKENQLLQEREKLKQVIQKLEEEEKNVQNSLAANSSNYQKDDYVKAHLEYLGNKKILDIRNIKPKPYFARIDFLVWKG